MKTPDEIKKGLAEEIPVHYHLPDPEPRLHPLQLVELEKLHASALARIQYLEKRLADVNASPFDGGMSQAEYFNGGAKDATD